MVLRSDQDLLLHLSGNGSERVRRELVSHVRPLGMRVAQRLDRSLAVDSLICQFPLDGFDQDPLTFKPSPAIIVHQANFLPDGRQAIVGVVCAEQDAVLGSRSKHAIGFVRRPGDQVIDHHAEVRLIASQHDRLALLQLANRVDARQKPLPRRFFVAAGAVYLAGQKKPIHEFGFE